jgi:hypothetical protein
VVRSLKATHSGTPLLQTRPLLAECQHFPQLPSWTDASSLSSVGLLNSICSKCNSPLLARSKRHLQYYGTSEHSVNISEHAGNIQ